MISAQQIRQFQDEAAAKAARSRKAPLALYSADTVVNDIRRCPNLGTYVKKGWRPLQDSEDIAYVDRKVIANLTPKAVRGSRSWAGHRSTEPEDFRLFIDKQGWGNSDEPALTIDEAVDNLKRALQVSGEHTIGIGIVEEGQFQLYLGLFVKETK